MDFWISQWISGFQLGFLDFWISVWISADGVRDFFRDGPLGSKRFRADLQALKDNDPTLQVSDKSVEPQAAVATC